MTPTSKPDSNDAVTAEGVSPYAAPSATAITATAPRATTMADAEPFPSIVLNRPPAWRWVHVAVAAGAMVATLPGRTQGLALVTEPILRDLDLSRVDYSFINLWATLLGAAFCLPIGWLIDRIGLRLVLSAVMGGLGMVVIAMSQVQGDWNLTVPFVGTIMADLFLFVLLTRGLGQSALSVVSLALVGKAAGRRQGLVIGVYSFTMGFGFALAFYLITATLKQDPLAWREVWASIGIVIAALTLPAMLLIRPRITGWSDDADGGSVQIGYTLPQALRTPAFWVFALATSFYGLIASGVTLFNESILKERGFDVQVFYTISYLAPVIGIVSNLGGGLLANWLSLNRLMAVAMFLMTTALGFFPYVQQGVLWQVYLYAAIMGVSGGIITVLFFAVWGQAYGPAHLGKIQGAAQMLTVIASALGPVLAAYSKEHLGSYTPLFMVLAALSSLIAVAAFFTRLPRPASAS